MGKDRFRDLLDLPVHLPLPRRTLRSSLVFVLLGVSAPKGLDAGIRILSLRNLVLRVLAKGKVNPEYAQPANTLQKVLVRRGPNASTLIRWVLTGLVEDDWEYEEESIPDVTASSGMVLPVLVCEARPEQEGVRWVIDTGAGIHLVPEPGPGGVVAAPPIKIQTANGIVTTSTKTLVPSSELGGQVEAYLLKGSPYILSVGRLQQKGFTFRWTSGQPPVLIRPDKTLVALQVQTNVPFMHQALIAMVIPVYPRMASFPPE